MATTSLEWTSTTVNNGFTDPDNVATADDSRATAGVAADDLRIALDNSPGDYSDTNSGNTVTLTVQARTQGTINRQKQLVLTLTDSSGTAIQDSGASNITFTTSDLTGSDADYTSSAFTLADNYTGTNVDGWELAAAVTEGGGMPDSATVEIDYLAVSVLDYDIPTTLVQSDFRIRASGGQQDASGVDPETDTGWEAAENTSVTTDFYDQEFRIRFAVACTVGSVTDAFQLRAQKNGAGGYTAVPNVTTPWTAATEQSEIACVPSTATNYPDTSLSTSRLSGTGSYVAGQAVETNASGTLTVDSGEYTEIEYCILIRKASGDGYLVDTDYFDFRVYLDDGTPLDTYTNTARVTLASSSRGIIGGSWSETPGRSWIQDTDGNIYAAIEMQDALTGTYVDDLIIVKSTDGGQSWTAPDLAGIWGRSDIEAVDMHYIAADHTIYIVIEGPTGDDVFYGEFYTAGHATTPDEYAAADETVDTTVVNIEGQCCAITRRASDGVTWAAYLDGSITTSGYSDVALKKRTSGGTWDASPTALDSTASVDCLGAWMAIDSSNVIHLIYGVQDRVSSTSGEVYHKSISTGDSLSGRTKVNGSITMVGNDGNWGQVYSPPRIYNDGATERIGVIFMDDSNDLWFTQSPVSSISFSTPQQITDAPAWHDGGGSQSAVADMAWDDTDDEAIAVWSDEVDFDLMMDVRTSGTWGTDTTEESGVNVAWVRSEIFTYSSTRYLGIMWDDHPSPGGTGGIAFKRISRGTVTTELSPATGTLTLTGQTPTLATTANVFLTAATAALTFTGQTPTVLVDENLEPATAALTLSGQTPTADVAAHVSLAPATGALDLTGYAPTVAATANVWLAPTTGALTLTGKRLRPMRQHM